MTFVAMYSLISALIVSMMGKQEMDDLPFLNVPIQTPYATIPRGPIIVTKAGERMQLEE